MTDPTDRFAALELLKEQLASAREALASQRRLCARKLEEEREAAMYERVRIIMRNDGYTAAQLHAQAAKAVNALRSEVDALQWQLDDERGRADRAARAALTAQSLREALLTSRRDSESELLRERGEAEAALAEERDRHRTHLARVALARLRKRELARGWVKWSGTFWGERRLRRLAQRAMGRLSQGKLAASAAAWRQDWEGDRMMRLAKSAAQRFSAQHMSRAWNSWGEEARAAQRLRRLRRGAGRLTKPRLAASLAEWRRGWDAWRREEEARLTSQRLRGLEEQLARQRSEVEAMLEAAREEARMQRVEHLARVAFARMR